jgi:phenylpropionate dioxygenase-like ring-hydroxylating dioxygenase large terminal subunit
MPTLYQQARKAGLNPNHWYVVERSRSLRRGAVKEVIFWERSIALFRCSDGSLGAIANSCAHRRIKLTLGRVCADRLVCPYHGWEYDSGGRVIRIPHDLFGHAMPRVCVTAYPVCERFGLVWIFPGDRDRAAETPLPQIPELEGPHPWAAVHVDFVWRAHFSFIIENLLDFTHAYLHRRYRPFADAVLTRSESCGDKVVAEYSTAVGSGRISGLFVNRDCVDATRITSCFEYPYQRASTDDKIKHWCFLTPLDVRRTRVFFSILFASDALCLPLTRLSLPHRCVQLFLCIAKRLMITPLLKEDGEAVEAEQDAFDSIQDARFMEFNPVAALVQRMIVQRWQAYATVRTEHHVGHADVV